MKSAKYVLGVSAFYHDSAAAILRDGEILAAAQEERFTRRKHDPSFPKNAVAFCLDQAGVSLDELEAVVFYDKPLLKFERLLETYRAFSPRGLQSFVKSLPVWIKEKLFFKNLFRDHLAEVMAYDRKKLKLLFTEHHLSHAASAFYPSGFTDAAILTIDGVGEWATASIAHGQKTQIKILREMKFPHSLGLLYSAFTQFLGFRVNSGEYKLMGLAPYGNPSGRTDEYCRLITEKMIRLHDDGSIWLDQSYFNYATGLSMVNERKWQELFGMPRREPEGETRQEHCDLALAIQRVTEDVVLRMAREAHRLTGARNLCLAGGVALNCVANGRLLRAKIFDQIWIQPAAGDAGGALGAAYSAHFIYAGNARSAESREQMHGAYLGPEYTFLDVERMARKYEANFDHFESDARLFDHVAGLLASGAVVGWIQGRSEWGPRSLGNRSILGDARNPEMQKRLNLKIKNRESFRPFAPIVCREDLEKYFELDCDSPYMLLVAGVNRERRRPLPQDFHAWSLKEKLYFVRSDLPAITHLDYSARVQTVDKTTNPRIWELLKSFERQTLCGVLVNTSFNVRGEPIVQTPEDGYRCFMGTDMDYLVVGNYLFDKKAQPQWSESSPWKTLD